MEYTPQVFLNCIANKKPLASIVEIIGLENYYRVNALNALIEYVFEGIEPQDREIHRFEQELDVAELEQSINSYPFFGGKSMVIIAYDKFFEVSNKGGLSENKAKLHEKIFQILKDIPDYCTVVFYLSKFDKRLKLYKNLKNMADVCLCEPIKADRLVSWLKEQAALLGGSFDYSGIGQIVGYMEQVDIAPLALLEQELAKLAAVFGTVAPWTSAQVEQVFSDLPQLGQFKLIDAVAKGNLPAALKYLQIESKKSRSEPDLVLGGLRSKLKLMIRVLEYQRAGISFAKMVESFTDLTSAQYQLKMVVANLRNGFTMDKLVWAFHSLSEVNCAKRKYNFSNEETFNQIKNILIVFLDQNN